ncbi:hypothetical protein KGD87_30425 [Myxococcus sp. SDU36]|nr:hypothetical protein KGD87_30425 [Myxococcus sp. SDU36]
MVTPVGLNAPTTAAAVRAGIVRTRETSILDLRFHPFVAGFLEAMPELALLPASFSYREERMLRLAVPALQEAAREAGKAVLLLGLPEEQSDPQRAGNAFLQELIHASGTRIEPGASRSFPLGRAAGLWALAEAIQLISAGRAQDVLVGGVDSLVDPMVLAGLEADHRIAGTRPSDVFIPGEGAGFLWLAPAGTARRRRREALGEIFGMGVGREPGYRESLEPYLGEGLSAAFHEAFADMPRGEQHNVRTVYLSFNGESFWAKEWGVGHLRFQSRFDGNLRVEHPVENFGDPGAGLGPLMVGLATMALRRGYRQGPCLVSCSSDREERAAVLLRSVEQGG